MNTVSTQTEIDEKKICHHCGEDCGDVNVVLEEKSFCCEGCKMVFEILDENGLCKYYELDENAGISLKGKSDKKYAWLDDAEIQEKIIQFKDEKITRVLFYLPQIHCASCVWLLENLYKFNPGIHQSKINFLKKEIHLTFDEKEISLRKVAELLASIGYAPEINLGDLDEPKRKAVDKQLIYQLGVTGFAFGNIMLLSFPEYLGLDDLDVNNFQKWFGYLNIFLALPVVFFGGKDYLRSAFLSLQKGNLNIDVPISIGILTLFGRSIFEIVNGVGAGYLDSLAGLVFFLLIGKWFQQITYNHLSFERDYKSYFPVAALLTNGKTVTLEKLKPGDTIVIKNKELIPADGILLSGTASIDYSFVTGESEPVPKKNGETLFAGGRQIGGQLQIQITKKVSQSYLTQLWNDSIFANEEQKSDTQSLADQVGKYFTFTILTIASLTLLFWLPKDVGMAVNAFTAVLIIACPCAVALSIPFTFGNAIRILASRHFYLKNTQVIENLQQITSVVFDKTGTLTSANEAKEISFHGKPLSPIEKSVIGILVAQSSHPLSQQILKFLKSEKDEIFDVENFEEIEGMGIQGFVNQQFIKLGSAHFTQNKNLSGGKVGKEIGSVFLQINHQDRGFFQIKNQYREGLENVISFFKNEYKIHLLSGDNDATRDQLEPFFGKNLHFHQSPKDKLNFIKNLQAEGEKVLMLGDGLNDAGALRQSDVGMVITEDTNNFTPASDGILSAEVFTQLPQFLTFLKSSLRMVWVAYGLAFIYNVVGLSFAVQAKLSPLIAAILMPASSITIVLFGVLSVSWLARRLMIF